MDKELLAFLQSLPEPERDQVLDELLQVIAFILDEAAGRASSSKCPKPEQWPGDLSRN